MSSPSPPLVITDIKVIDSFDPFMTFSRIKWTEKQIICYSFEIVRNKTENFPKNKSLFWLNFEFIIEIKQNL